MPELNADMRTPPGQIIGRRGPSIQPMCWEYAPGPPSVKLTPTAVAPVLSDTMSVYCTVVSTNEVLTEGADNYAEVTEVALVPSFALMVNEGSRRWPIRLLSLALAVAGALAPDSSQH